MALASSMVETYLQKRKQDVSLVTSFDRLRFQSGRELFG